MERDKIVANSVVTATYGLNLVIASVEPNQVVWNYSLIIPL